MDALSRDSGKMDCLKDKDKSTGHQARNTQGLFPEAAEREKGRTGTLMEGSGLESGKTTFKTDSDHTSSPADR